MMQVGSWFSMIMSCISSALPSSVSLSCYCSFAHWFRLLPIRLLYFGTPMLAASDHHTCSPVQHTTVHEALGVLATVIHSAQHQHSCQLFMHCPVLLYPILSAWLSLSACLCLSFCVALYFVWLDLCFICKLGLECHACSQQLMFSTLEAKLPVACCMLMADGFACRTCYTTLESHVQWRFSYRPERPLGCAHWYAKQSFHVLPSRTPSKTYVLFVIFTLYGTASCGQVAV